MGGSGDVASSGADTDTYAGFSRFELELEFVQALGNPQYVFWLATDETMGIVNDPDFVAYVKYLQYWKRPEYSKYLLYPGTSLRMLDLLEQEDFRKAMSSGVAGAGQTAFRTFETWARAVNKPPPAST